MCTRAPELGNMVESSANTKAKNSTARAPMVQEAMLKGPACREAFKAPNSQPEPMMLPKLAYSRPMTPASRRTLSGAVMSLRPLYRKDVVPGPKSLRDRAILDDPKNRHNSVVA